MIQQNRYCRACSQCFSYLLYMGCHNISTNTCKLCVVRHFFFLSFGVVLIFFSQYDFFLCIHKLRDDHLSGGIKVHATDVTYFTRQSSLELTTGQTVFIFIQEVSRKYKNNCAQVEIKEK